MDFLQTLCLFLCSVTVSVTAVTLQCPAYLVNDRYLRHFGTHCYQFVLNHHGDWDHANSDCRQKGGYLVDIHSSSEQAFIYNSLQVLGLHGDMGVWIGLTDKDKEGTWKWTSGTDVNFKAWAPGQPGVLGITEDCALFVYSSRGTWHDYPCVGIIINRQNHGWVCKFAEVPVTTNTPSTAQHSATTRTGSSSQQSTEMSSSTVSSSLMSSTVSSGLTSPDSMSSQAQSSAMMSSSLTQQMASATTTATKLSSILMSSTPMNMMTSSISKSLPMSSTPTSMMTSSFSSSLLPSSPMMSSTIKSVSSAATQTMMSSTVMKTITSPASMKTQTTTMKQVSTT